MKRLKVLYLTNLPAPYKIDFFNELSKYADVTVFFEKHNMESRDANWINDCEMKFTVIYGKPIVSFDESAVCFDVIKVLKGKYDAIVAGYYSSITEMIAIEYMKMHRIPYILHTDGGIIKETFGIKYSIKKRYISSASMWFSTGKSVEEYLCNYGAKRDLIRWYPFSSVKKEDVLDSSVSSDEKKVLRKELGIIEDKVVLSVGQFIYRKGYDLLLNSLAGLKKDVGVYIIGGKPTEEYAKIVKEHNLTNVHFISFLDKEKLKKFYMAADIFVLPTREDIWGLVINEAMSFGLPILTTDKCVAGMEMIDGNGLICKLDSDWGKEIMNLLNTDDLCDMKEKSLMIAKLYTIEEMAKAQFSTIKVFVETRNI